MVGADLEGFIATHDETDLVGLLVFEETDVTGTALLPFLGVFVESEELGAHLEGGFFVFFVRLDFDLVFELNDGLEMRVVLGFLGGGCAGLLGL